AAKVFARDVDNVVFQNCPRPSGNIDDLAGSRAGLLSDTTQDCIRPALQRRLLSDISNFHEPACDSRLLPVCEWGISFSGCRMVHRRPVGREWMAEVRGGRFICSV